jgi:hypothetical protein
MSMVAVGLIGAAGIWAAIFAVVGILLIWEILDDDLKMFLGRSFAVFAISGLGYGIAVLFYHSL